MVRTPYFLGGEGRRETESEDTGSREVNWSSERTRAPKRLKRDSQVPAPTGSETGQQRLKDPRHRSRQRRLEFKKE